MGNTVIWNVSQNIIIDHGKKMCTMSIFIDFDDVKFQQAVKYESK